MTLGTSIAGYAFAVTFARENSAFVAGFGPVPFAYA